MPWTCPACSIHTKHEQARPLPQTVYRCRLEIVLDGGTDTLVVVPFSAPVPTRTARHMSEPKTCGKCREGWICEQHPALPWRHPDQSQPDGVCAGPGIPCDAPTCSYSLATLTPNERRSAARH